MQPRTTFDVPRCGHMWFRCCVTSLLAFLAPLQRKAQTIQWHGAAGSTSRVLYPADRRAASWAGESKEEKEDQVAEGLLGRYGTKQVDPDRLRNAQYRFRPPQNGNLTTYVCSSSSLGAADALVYCTSGHRRLRRRLSTCFLSPSARCFRVPLLLGR